MNKQTFTRITTIDTKKTYELPSENSPQLWEVQIVVSYVDQNGRTDDYFSCTESAYFERQTLVDCGMMPVSTEDRNPPINTQPSLEGLFRQMLEHIGVYPQ